MSENTLEEFLTVVARDLGAESAHVLNAGDVGDEAPGSNRATLSCDLPGGRRLVVYFAAPPADVEALRRRLAMLASAFGDILPRRPARPSRPPPGRSLHEELSALAKRASAVDAVVIDAHSPVVWARASEAGEAGEAADLEPPLSAPGPAQQVPPPAVSLVSATGAPANEEAPDQDLTPVTRLPGPAPVPAPRTSGEHLSLVEDDEPEAPAPDEGEPPDLTRRALDEVRALPEIAELKRGGHVRHMSFDERFGCVAHSFAAIYVLVLVYEGTFDELLAKRAIAQALPTIERLVAALPPVDPEPPMAGAAALRPRRRRR